MLPDCGKSARCWWHLAWGLGQDKRGANIGYGRANLSPDKGNAGVSNTDSFIEEVTDEVRRDRLYGYLKRYGWIAALAIALIVGGAGFNEYRRAQQEARAQALGDAMLAALTADEDAGRAAALADVSADTSQGAAVLAFMTAGAQADAGDSEAATQTLQAVTTNADVPLIYRQIATFKSLVLQANSEDPATLRAGFETLAVPGVPLRMLATEQLALIDISDGDTDAAIARFQSILEDAEATPGLQRRALQAMVALGGDPQAPTTENEQ